MIEIPIEPDDETLYYLQRVVEEMGYALTYEEVFALYRSLVEHEMMED